mgnify:CR=1 FL=1
MENTPKSLLGTIVLIISVVVLAAGGTYFFLEKIDKSNSNIGTAAEPVPSEVATSTSTQSDVTIPEEQIASTTAPEILPQVATLAATSSDTNITLISVNEGKQVKIGQPVNILYKIDNLSKYKNPQVKISLIFKTPKSPSISNLVTETVTPDKNKQMQSYTWNPKCIDVRCSDEARDDIAQNQLLKFYSIRLTLMDGDQKVAVSSDEPLFSIAYSDLKIANSRTPITITSPLSEGLWIGTGQHTVAWQKVTGDFDQFHLVLMNKLFGQSVVYDMGVFGKDKYSASPYINVQKFIDATGAYTESDIRNNMYIQIQAEKKMPDGTVKIVASGQSMNFSILDSNDSEFIYEYSSPASKPGKVTVIDDAGTKVFATKLTVKNDGDESIVSFNPMVPKNSSLIFDYKFTKRGDGDWFSVDFSGTPLFTFLGSSYYDDKWSTSIGTASPEGGVAGVLRFTLHGAGSDSSELLIKNIRFVEKGTDKVLLEYRLN